MVLAGPTLPTGLCRDVPHAGDPARHHPLLGRRGRSTALIEVFSPTTEACDRGRKFEKYQTLPSVREYLLVSQDRPASNATCAATTAAGSGVRMARANACPLPARALTSRSTTSMRARSTPIMTPRPRRDPRWVEGGSPPASGPREPCKLPRKSGTSLAQGARLRYRRDRSGIV